MPFVSSVEDLIRKIWDFGTIPENAPVQHNFTELQEGSVSSFVIVKLD